MGSIRNKNDWNNASKRLFGSYSHSGIPGFYSGYSAPRSRIAGIYSGIHSYSGIFPNKRALSEISGHTTEKIQIQHPKVTTVDGLNKTEVSIFASNRWNQTLIVWKAIILVFQKPGEGKQDRRQAVQEMQKLILFSENLFIDRQFINVMKH